MHANSAAVNIGMVVTGVDQYADFLRSDLGRSISKHKQHWVNDVRFAAAIWSNYCWKILQQWWYKQ